MSLAADGCRVRGTLAKPGFISVRKPESQLLLMRVWVICIIFLFDGAYHVEVLLLLSHFEGFKGHEKAIERLPTLDVNIYCFVTDRLPIIQVPCRLSMPRAAPFRKDEINLLISSTLSPPRSEPCHFPTVWYGVNGISTNLVPSNQGGGTR